MKTLLIRGDYPPPPEVREIIAGGSTEVAEVSEGEAVARGTADRVVEWTGRELLLDDRRLRWPEDADEIRMLFETGG